MEDTDIPLPDELERLESQLYHEDDDDDIDPFPFPYPPDEEDGINSEQDAAPESQIIGQKRSLVGDESAGPANEKRSRTTPDHGEDEDGDWLCYAPSRKSHSVDHQDQSGSEPEEVTVSRYMSRIDGECVPVTAPNGDRVYAKLCRSEMEREDKKLSSNFPRGDLVSESINDLLQRYEQEAFSKALQASSENQTVIQLPETPNLYEKLWVEKYAPNSFTELLSDEQTNREVLLWLKQWDSCVFGSAIRTTPDDVLSALRHHSSVSHHKQYLNTSSIKRSSWRKEGFGHHTNLDSEDSHTEWTQESSKNARITGPPEHKILLLCGPPGLGKTTLAHVAAKHCGYRVVEINASDDRSSSTIESKILDVVQMNSVMADAKPKCLVIDEIDGALGDGKGAIEVIMKMHLMEVLLSLLDKCQLAVLGVPSTVILGGYHPHSSNFVPSIYLFLSIVQVSAEKKSQRGNHNLVDVEQSGKNSSRRRQKTSSLSRPVICICNDLYAPALRPLRQIAKVHKFVQPSISRVVNRLKYICNKEGMSTSSIALTALAEYTERDIRSCLNTLQFLSKKKETLDVVDISSQVVGRKDMSTSMFDIWKEIFQKRKFKSGKKSSHDENSTLRGFNILHSLISSRGDYDLMMDGVHDNILQQQYHDPVMKKTVMCLDYIGASDHIHQYIMRTHHMHLQVYQPSIVIAIHRLIAQVSRPNIEWPKSFQRFRTTMMEKADTLRTWKYRITPYISRHLSIKSFIEDLISPLMHLLSPPNLRPVAINLLSGSEKNDLTELVSRMISYCISYKKLSSEVQSSNKVEATIHANSLTFDPPIDDYISFKDYVPSHHVLALAMKQVLLHEVEKQKILHGSNERSATLAVISTTENKVIVGAETGGSKSSTHHTENFAKTKIENRHNKVSESNFNASTHTIASPLAPSEAIAAATRGTKDAKRPFNGFNYFDRFRKSNSSCSEKSENAVLKPVKLERDSHPVLFKFNEGFTNAIKRPMRIRDFLQ